MKTRHHPGHPVGVLHRGRPGNALLPAGINGAFVILFLLFLRAGIGRSGHERASA